MKYDIRFCSCGRIHFIRRKNMMRAASSNRELAVICGGCGDVKIIGWNKSYDEYLEEDCYDTYQYSLSDKSEITRSQFKSSAKGKMLYKIIYSEGTKVPMKTGYFANFYAYATFFDTRIPDFLSIELSKKSATVDEIRNKYEKWKTDSTTVDIERLFSKSGLSKEQVDHLSAYLPFLYLSKEEQK